MSDIHYSFVPKIGGHPVHQFLIGGALEVVAAGHATLASVNYDLSAIIAYRDIELELVGAVAFGVQEWDSTCHIHWAYVRPNDRRLGIHTHMIRRLEAEALRRNCHKVVRGTHLLNKPAQISFEKQGYHQTMVTYEKRIISHATHLRNPQDAAK